MIDACAFGKMIIDGKTYTSDLIIFPDGSVADSWWRQRGHVLTLSDMEALMKAHPEMIVAGTGTSGRMRPETGLSDLLKKKKIAFTPLENDRAVKVYNTALSSGKRIGGCFHLTC